MIPLNKYQFILQILKEDNEYIIEYINPLKELDLHTFGDTDTKVVLGKDLKDYEIDDLYVDYLNTVRFTKSSKVTGEELYKFNKPISYGIYVKWILACNNPYYRYIINRKTGESIGIANILPDEVEEDSDNIKLFIEELTENDMRIIYAGYLKLYDKCANTNFYMDFIKELPIYTIDTEEELKQYEKIPIE